MEAAVERRRVKWIEVMMLTRLVPYVGKKDREICFGIQRNTMKWTTTFVQYVQ